MPIGNITQTISELPAAGRRGVDVQTQFVIKQEDFQDHLQGTTVTELNTFKDQLNIRIGEINSTATTMNGYATSASSSASTATTKAGEASTSATAALNSKNQASTFATNSSNSATKASQWADNNYNVAVETGKYSAKHWAAVAQNTAASVSNFGFKNYIINGNFNVWQYGASQTTSGYGSDDRWVNFNVGSTKTHSRTITNKAEPFNTINYSTTVVSSVAGAGNATGTHQRIEGVNTLHNKTCTLSFYAKANTTKNIAIDFVQYFGTGGTPSAMIEGISATKIQITSSWAKYTITANIPSILGKSAGTDGNDSFWVRFWFDAGSDFNTRTNSLGQQSGTFDIAQVQLEEGSVATPFENRPYGLELILCQRYLPLKIQAGYFGSYGSGYVAINSTTYATVTIPLATTSRSLVYSLLTSGNFQLVSGNATFNVTSLAVDTNNTDSRVLSLTVTCSGGGLTSGNACTLRSANSPNSYILLTNEL